MAKSYEVMQFLRPNGGYTQVGENYEGITFIDCEPFSKEEYLAAFNLTDMAKEQEALEIANKKSELLAKLGITEEEAKLLLS